MVASSSPYAPLHALIGTVLDGRFRLEEMIGTGGMGAIFRARREGLERPLALKVLHPALSSDPTTAKRLEREAYSVSKLDHPGIVRVSDFGTTEQGLSYIAMELIEGTQLSSHLGQPMAPARAVDLITQVLEALDHAHAAGVVHRDLKPDNVLVVTDTRGGQQVKIVDFGIAKVIDDRKAHERLTQTGFIYGTPHYMSPEQATGGAVDHRADLYAVGLILYEMLAGRRAFRALDPASMLRKQVTQPPDPLPADVPRRLAHVVMRLLEKEPAARPKSAREVLRALAATRARLEGVPAARADPGELATRADPAAATVAMKEGPAATLVEPAAPAPARVARGARAPFGSWASVALIVIALGGAVGYLLVREASEPERAAEAGGPSSPEPGPPPDDGKVSILIHTNVEADIVDAADGGIYGRTNRPLVLDRSERELALILRAQGFDDVQLTLRPNGDKRFEHALRPTRPRKHVVDLKDPWKRDQPVPEATPGVEPTDPPGPE